MFMYVLERGIYQTPGTKRSLEILKHRLRGLQCTGLITASKHASSGSSFRKKNGEDGNGSRKSARLNSMPRNSIHTSNAEDHEMLRPMVPDAHPSENPRVANSEIPGLGRAKPVGLASVANSTSSMGPGNSSTPLTSTETSHIQDWINTNNATIFSAVPGPPIFSHGAASAAERHIGLKSTIPTQQLPATSNHAGTTGSMSGETDDWSTLYSLLTANETAGSMAGFTASANLGQMDLNQGVMAVPSYIDLATIGEKGGPMWSGCTSSEYIDWDNERWRI